jgi:hypothetical protein
LAISLASAGLALPATSLTAPFLADIDASPRDVVDTTFNILTPQNLSDPDGGGVSRSSQLWQYAARGFRRKIRHFRRKR